MVTRDAPVDVEPDPLVVHGDGGSRVDGPPPGAPPDQSDTSTGSRDPVSANPGSPELGPEH